MAKRRPPTAATFAWLAALSAVACAVLPEIIDLTHVGWRRTNEVGAATSRRPGPRVMGSLHTAEDVEVVVDRFRFAAGLPFTDGHNEQPAAVGRRLEPAEHALDLPPDRVAPASPVGARDLNASRHVERNEGVAAIPAEAVVARPDAVPSPSDAENSPAAAVARIGDADARPASEAVMLPPAALSVPVETATGAVETEGGGTTPVPLPSADKPVESKAAAETQPTKRPDLPRQVEPKQVTKRATAGLQGGKRRSAAADDGEAPAPKAKWRPENLNNWPD